MTLNFQNLGPKPLFYFINEEKKWIWLDVGQTVQINFSIMSINVEPTFGYGQYD